MRRHRHMVPRATQLHLTAWRVGRFQLKTRNINLRLPEKCGCPTGQVRESQAKTVTVADAADNLPQIKCIASPADTAGSGSPLYKTGCRATT